jgi:hypothetical protein
MDIKAKEILRPFNNSRNFPQNSYILISTNLFFEYEKKNEPSVCRFVSAKFRFVLLCVCGHHGCELQKTFRLSALASLPLGLFMLSFVGSINIRTEKMN